MHEAQLAPGTGESLNGRGVADSGAGGCGGVGGGGLGGEGPRRHGRRVTVDE